MAVVSEFAVAVYGFQKRARVLEPAGISYEFNLVKDNLTLGHSTHPVFRGTLLLNDSANDLEKLDESDLSYLDKDDSKYFKYVSKLDPTEVKEQDHYKVLGLSKLRYKATTNQIKLAYRQKVLKYHPDKGNAVSKDVKNERIFGCIQKAYEQLGMYADKRRAYDSVDPTFDESIPDSKEVNRANFFDVLRPIFERNSRFSIRRPVPQLGDEQSDHAHVDAFYDFWFDWSSWREFSYLDSEDKSKGEDKWERREIEKMNKAEREKRRKKDMKRISSLVSLAYEKDPRIAAFKEEQRRQKEQAKEQKRMERERKEKEQREADEAEKRSQEAERLAQLERDKKANQEKQKKKKQLTAQRKKLRDLCTNMGYWTQDEDKRHSVMEQVERVCIYADMEEIGALCLQLAEIQLFENAFQQLTNCAKSDEKSSTQANGNALQSNNKQNGKPVSDWSASELRLLVKAVGLFPPGTAERWRFVAEYVSNHAIQFGGKERTEKEVIKQVKALSAVDSSSNSANQIKDNDALLRENGAALTFNNEPTNQATANGNSLSLNGKTVTNTTAISGGSAEIWSVEQQKQLEAALKQISAKDDERWEKIAKLVDGKTKKDCVKRYKHLAELLKQTKSKS